MHCEENITLEAVNVDVQPSGAVSESPSSPATGLAREVGVQSGWLGCMLQELMIRPMHPLLYLQI